MYFQNDEGNHEVYVIEVDERKATPATKSTKSWHRAFGKAVLAHDTIEENDPNVSSKSCKSLETFNIVYTRNIFLT